MNISGIIKQAKRKVDGYKQAKTVTTANKLKDLKAERVKLEGRAKILKTQTKEKERIRLAKENIKKEGTAYKTFQKLKKMKVANDKRKESKKDSKKDIWGGNSRRNVF